MRLILMEAAGVSLLAGILGFVGGMGLTRLILPFLAQDHPHLVWDPMLGVGSIFLALLMGILASLYPAMRASRLDPSDALRAL
jgi:putative ABC transport system permease protein